MNFWHRRWSEIGRREEHNSFAQREHSSRTCLFLMPSLRYQCYSARPLFCSNSIRQGGLLPLWKPVLTIVKPFRLLFAQKSNLKHFVGIPCRWRGSAGRPDRAGPSWAGDMAASAHFCLLGFPIPLPCTTRLAVTVPPPSLPIISLSLVPSNSHADLRKPLLSLGQGRFHNFAKLNLTQFENLKIQTRVF